MVNYAKSDVERVAAFVLSRSNYDYYAENGDYTPEYRCDLCGAYLLQEYDSGKYTKPDLENFKHKGDCIYLVAQDLMSNGN